MHGKVKKCNGKVKKCNGSALTALNGKGDATKRFGGAGQGAVKKCNAKASLRVAALSTA